MRHSARFKDPEANCPRATPTVNFKCKGKNSTLDGLPFPFKYNSYFKARKPKTDMGLSRKGECGNQDCNIQSYQSNGWFVLCFVVVFYSMPAKRRVDFMYSQNPSLVIKVDSMKWGEERGIKGLFALKCAPSVAKAANLIHSDGEVEERSSFPAAVLVTGLAASGEFHCISSIGSHTLVLLMVVAAFIVVKRKANSAVSKENMQSQSGQLEWDDDGMSQPTLPSRHCSSDANSLDDTN